MTNTIQELVIMEKDATICKCQIEIERLTTRLMQATEILESVQKEDPDNKAFDNGFWGEKVYDIVSCVKYPGKSDD